MRFWASLSRGSSSGHSMFLGSILSTSVRMVSPEKGGTPTRNWYRIIPIDHLHGRVSGKILPSVCEQDYFIFRDNIVKMLANLTAVEHEA